jgi:hypothetical protein
MKRNKFEDAQQGCALDPKAVRSGGFAEGSLKIRLNMPVVRMEEDRFDHSH